MTDSRTLVSVIIPARNAARTIAETLDSLQGQTFESWQALVVDDASTDRTAEIVADRAAGDPRIRLLSGPGKSAANARNVGLAEADGKWVLFLDADDWIAPHHLSALLAVLAARPDAVAAYGHWSRVLRDGRVLPPIGDSGLAQDPAAVLVRNTGVAIHAILVARAAVMRVGGFDPELATCEDWDLWQRIARLGGAWLFAPDALCFYRMSEASLTRDVPRLIADAATVIGRVRAPDDRVPDAAPGLRDGLAGPDSPSATENLYEVVYWFAAVELPAAEGAAQVAAFLAGRPRPVDPGSTALAATLVHGVAYGLAIDAAMLAEHWPDYGPRLTALVDALGSVAAEPGAGRRLQYRVERAILELDDLATPRALGLTLGLRLDRRAVLTGANPPTHVDMLHLRLVHGPWKDLRVDLGILGPVTRFGMAELLLDFAPSSKTDGRARHRHLLRAARALHHLLRRGGRFLQQRGVHGRRSHAGVLAGLRRRADGDSGRQPGPAPARRVAAGANWAEARHDKGQAAYWDDIFRDADPWNYASPYEQEKYERQLQMLPGGAIGTALELACAEGHFSRQLSPRVGRLIATDISPAALVRARERCAGLANIEFSPLDLVADPLPEGLDLIVCSEVLYFLPDADSLRHIASRLAAALAPGGHLLVAHAFVLGDSRNRTAFDWSDPFGAETISKVLECTPTLALAQSLETDLYRIDLFVRTDGPPPRPVRRQAPITAEIEPDVARYIIPDGAVMTRSEAAQRERHSAVPVLMYHRIAEDGPDGLARYRVSPEEFRKQLVWLRRNGFHTITSGELEWFIRHRHPISGRPVVLTFDDGFEDFSSTAWPLLRSFDFRPEVFIVTDLAGGTSDWDSARGGAFPLMAPQTIARLHADGVSFGSHLASHRPADGLSTRELADELLRSRAKLTEWLGRAPASLAAPYGRADRRLRRLARECGYDILFSTRPALADLDSDPFDLPRIEVRGDMALDEFVAGLENHLEPHTPT